MVERLTVLFLLVPAMLSAQDSVRVDSTLAWTTHTRSYFTKTVVRVDTVRIPMPSVVAKGIPFGPAGFFTSNTTLGVGADIFTSSMNPDNPTGIVARINAARALRHTLFLTPAGGKHDNYITAGTFDLAKWKARIDLYNTPAIKDAIAQGVKDGTVRGANILDEPQHSSWGGSLSKPILDGMAVYLKGYFPSLPVGVAMKFGWKPEQVLTRMDFVVTQYVDSWGSVTAWRDKELAGAKKDGVAVVFSLNILNGGAGFGETSCPEPATGGKGYSEGRCAMSPAQIREAILALAPFACAVNLWQYDSAYIAKPGNQAAFRDARAMLGQLPAKSCLRVA